MLRFIADKSSVDLAVNNLDAREAAFCLLSYDDWSYPRKLLEQKFKSPGFKPVYGDMYCFRHFLIPKEEYRKLFELHEKGDLIGSSFAYEDLKYKRRKLFKPYAEFFKKAGAKPSDVQSLLGRRLHLFEKIKVANREELINKLKTSDNFARSDLLEEYWDKYEIDNTDLEKIKTIVEGKEKNEPHSEVIAMLSLLMLKNDKEKYREAIIEDIKKDESELPLFILESLPEKTLLNLMKFLIKKLKKNSDGKNGRLFLRYMSKAKVDIVYNSLKKLELTKENIDLAQLIMEYVLKHDHKRGLELIFNVDPEFRYSLIKSVAMNFYSDDIEKKLLEILSNADEKTSNDLLFFLMNHGSEKSIDAVINKIQKAKLRSLTDKANDDNYKWNNYYYPMIYLIRGHRYSPRNSSGNF